MVAVSRCTSFCVVQIPLKVFGVDEAELVVAHNTSGQFGHTHLTLQPDWVDVIDS